jgi:hypothetical protein
MAMDIAGAPGQYQAVKFVFCDTIFNGIAAGVTTKPMVHHPGADGFFQFGQLGLHLRQVNGAR